MREGPARLKLKGRFMGSGEMEAEGTFRPEANGPDFDMSVAIRNTDMKLMNDLFRAYGNFDVTAGDFSFFSEVSVKGSDVTGYLKPIFSEVDVYDKRQDKEKGLFRKTYERMVGGLAALLENPRESVATKAPFEGKIEEPKAGTWPAVANLVRNAFYRSILPGFEENVG